IREGLPVRRYAALETASVPDHDQNVLEIAFSKPDSGGTCGSGCAWNTIKICSVKSTEAVGNFPAGRTWNPCRYLEFARSQPVNFEVPGKRIVALTEPPDPGTCRNPCRRGRQVRCSVDDAAANPIHFRSSQREVKSLDAPSRLKFDGASMDNIIDARVVGPGIGFHGLIPFDNQPAVPPCENIVMPGFDAKDPVLSTVIRCCRLRTFNHFCSIFSEYRTG